LLLADLLPVLVPTSEKGFILESLEDGELKGSRSGFIKHINAAEVCEANNRVPTMMEYA